MDGWMHGSSIDAWGVRSLGGRTNMGMYIYMYISTYICDVSGWMSSLSGDGRIDEEFKTRDLRAI